MGIIFKIYKLSICFLVTLIAYIYLLNGLYIICAIEWKIAKYI